jgi:hypothetical protein
MKEPLDKFGAFFVQNLRDKMLDNLEMLLGGKLKAPEVQELQRKLARLNDDQKRLVRDLVERISTGGMHDFLFALQERADAGSIRVVVDDKEIAQLSDGLHGEIFGDEGWIVRFSRHPSETEMERSRWAKEQIQKMFGDKNEDKG